MKCVLAVGMAAIAVFMAEAGPASATGIWPAADQDIQSFKWSGFSFAPYFGYETLRLKGTGSSAFDDPSGWRLGGEADYDWQFGNLVLGISGEGYYTWYEGGAKFDPSLSARMTDYGTVRGKLGYASGRWLLYATGGYAFADMTIKNAATGFNDSNILNGWTAGAGIEWAWNDQVSLRGEVDHMSFASESFTSIPSGSQDIGANLDLFKIDFISRF